MTRKTTATLPIQPIPAAVVAAIAHFTWMPHGLACGDESGRLMTKLGKPIIESDPEFSPPTSPAQVDCDQALTATVAILRMLGAGQPGVSFGEKVDKAFGEAVKFLAKPPRPTRKVTSGTKSGK